MSKLLIWHHPPTAQTPADDVEQVSSVRRLYFEQRAHGSLAKVLTCYGCVLPCLFVSVLFSARLLMIPQWIWLPPLDLSLRSSVHILLSVLLQTTCLYFCSACAIIGTLGNLLWMWSFVPSKAWVLNIACGWCDRQSQVRISAFSPDSDIMFVILFGLIV